MIIRFANKTDIPQLKSIWKVCFGDSDEYIDFFFDHMFKPENAVVADICAFGGGDEKFDRHLVSSAEGASSYAGFAIVVCHVLLLWIK